MIKKIACVSVLAGTLLATAPTAQAAAAAAPVPPAGAPGAGLLNGLLGSLEVGNPVASPSTLLPAGLVGK
ncbi:hypothetical protein [Streptomyces beigongshangae]|uniref:hypothetical protein n=1 Tax=Streptomyces beigongshangae TaxID=2841597 RepID=UPI001C84EC87|nr:hypothetical protein [Streptomyces sp. REN17]